LFGCGIINELTLQEGLFIYITEYMIPQENNKCNIDNNSYIDFLIILR